MNILFYLLYFYNKRIGLESTACFTRSWEWPFFNFLSQIFLGAFFNLPQHRWKFGGIFVVYFASKIIWHEMYFLFYSNGEIRDVILPFYYMPNGLTSIIYTQQYSTKYSVMFVED